MANKLKKGIASDESEAIAAIRRHFYASAVYSPSFQMMLSYKSQPLVARFVPGHVWGSNVAGPSPSSVMVIGKMPGREESNKIRNFIGPSGKMLRDQVTALGVDPSSWYVTNIIRFTTPDNFQGALPKGWIDCCRPVLDIELSIVQPDFILCLGGEASKELINVQVDKGYGSAFDFTYRLSASDPGLTKTAKVVVCLHPAYLLRNAEKMSQFQLSLRQFVSLTQGHAPIISEEGLNHVVIDNEDQLNKLIDEIIASKPDAIAIDAEWFGRLPTEPDAFLRCFQFSWAHKCSCVVALTKPGGEWRFQGNPYKAFARLFLGEHVPRLIGHNVKADIAWLQDRLLPYGVDLEELAMPPQELINGPAMTRVMGGYDTMLAAHGIRETSDFELESLGVYYLGVPRYDRAVQEALDNGIPHGYMEDDVLYDYASYDACVTYRLFQLFNGRWSGWKDHECIHPGLLDADPYLQLNGRKPFWISMMAMTAFLEMEQTGISFDAAGCTELRSHFEAAKSAVLSKLQHDIGWPGFNPNSIVQKKEFLFGEALNGKKRGADNLPVRVRPETAMSLYLTPIQTTGKPPMPWSRVVEEGQTANYSPSTDKSSLSIYAHTVPLARDLCDVGFLRQAMSTALRAPTPGTVLGLSSEMEEEDDDDIPEDINRKGLMDYVCSNGAIHSLYFQTKETGRASSAKPNLMAVSKKRDKDYKRLLGPLFRPMRSLFRARPGRLIVEADFIGAELAMMAWLSGDAVMQDHVRRSNLPESDPNHFDIHSSFAVEIFHLNLPPIKSALEKAGKKEFRDAVKTIVFGIPYGRGIEAILVAVKEESGLELTLQQGEKIQESIFQRYNRLAAFFSAIESRVVSHKYLRDPFGGLRRFYINDDRKTVADAKREGRNFKIQGGVSRAMSMGLYYLRAYRRYIEKQLDYRLINQIHDAAVLEVAAKDVDVVATKVLPLCLSEANAFRPYDDDGRLVSDIVCKFGLDIHVYERWGQDLSHDDCDRLGIDRRWGKAPKAKAA
jgi:uracil-DNA glycosylase family 4